MLTYLVLVRRSSIIGRDVSHVTRDSDTTFKVNRSKVNLHGAGDILWRPPAQLVSDSTDCKKS